MKLKGGLTIRLINISSAARTILWACACSVISSCQPDRTGSTATEFKVVDATGIRIRLDSMPAPISVALPENAFKRVPVGKPIEVSTGAEVFVPMVETILAIDIDSLPKIAANASEPEPFNESLMEVEPPVMVMAKNPYVKDRNPQNFSTFGKLQGLTHANITSILEDRDGNIWFGTYGGGVTRYNGNTFTHFNEHQGMSHSIVLCMLEDADGNLWFGTGGGGVTFYDGFHFRHFQLSGSQGNDNVQCLLQDRKGRIWFGTKTQGAICYDGESIVRYSTASGLGSNAVLCMMQDVNGDIWFGTDGQGVVRFDGEHFTRISPEVDPSVRSIASILQDNDGVLWFGTVGNGLLWYDGKILQHLPTVGAVSNEQISTMCKDRFGHIWIGSLVSGLLRFDGSNFHHLSEKDGLMMNSIRCLYEDRSGNLWAGTYGLGVSKYDGRLFTYLTTTEGLSNKVICGLAAGLDGSVWLATGGGGVQRFDDGQLTTYTKKEGLCDDIILSICAGRDSSIWFGSLNNGVCRFDGNEFIHISADDGLGGNDIRCMLEDANGRMWFGSNGGGVSCLDENKFTIYTTRQGLPSNSIRSIAEDEAGNLWFGTMGGGVCRFDGESFIIYDSEQGLQNNDVLSIVNDRNGNLWFGTNGGGITRFDGERFVTFTDQDELTSNVVQSILEDRQGNLWFGTRFGISGLSKEEQHRLELKLKRNISNNSAFGNIHFSRYTYDDGFIGIGVNGGRSMLQAEDGSIWVAANDRLAVYHPEGHVPDPVAPKIELTGISLFNEPIDWISISKNTDTSLQLSNGVRLNDMQFETLSKWYSIPQNLSLRYDNNYLTFNFIGITMNRPKQVRYQYMLEGMDGQWSITTSKTETTYGNLPHGSYTFLVKATNSEGVWSEPLSYTFTIRPPWWLTWWAYGSYAILGIGSIALYIKWRERGLRERQRELEQTVTERTAEVVHEKAIVEEKNKQIIDSINYAQRIQSTILPSERAIKLHLPDAFVLYRPKDIVAGDFYWMELNDDGKIYLAACDCTGHGVPGALVSVVCHNALNKALHEFGCRTPAAILDKTTELVADNLNRNMELNDAVKDGMDASVCCIDPETGELHWAGANNPLLLVRKGKELLEVKADKQAVGHSDNRNHYTNHSFQLEKGDVFYLITDGFADQFGGPNNKKFQRAKLRELLFSVHHLQMSEQFSIIEKTFLDWQGTHGQLDDVTIIGVRLQGNLA